MNNLPNLVGAILLLCMSWKVSTGMNQQVYVRCLDEMAWKINANASSQLICMVLRNTTQSLFVYIKQIMMTLRRWVIEINIFAGKHKHAFTYPPRIVLICIFLRLMGGWAKQVVYFLISTRHKWNSCGVCQTLNIFGRSARWREICYTHVVVVITTQKRAAPTKKPTSIK